MKDSGNGNAGQTLPPATLFGALCEWARKIYWTHKFKRWLKNTPDDVIIEAHRRQGFSVWVSGDMKTTVLRKGKAMLRMYRDQSPNDPSSATAAGEGHQQNQPTRKNQ